MYVEKVLEETNGEKQRIERPTIKMTNYLN